MTPPTSGDEFGQYRIESQLGAGGMGTVYRAYDGKLERPVAIKFLKAGVDDDGDSSLLREARAASALNHPNICTIYEVGEANGRRFIVMELVDGRPLVETLTADGLPPEEVTHFGVQIADALSHAHERGVIHRDLKTANILATPDGRIKVLDFGLARKIQTAGPQDATITGTALALPAVTGTLAYMAPEVLRGERSDARGDVWGLGVVLYELAAGRLPFAGQTTFEIAAGILNDPLPPLPDRVPRGIAHIVERCLEKQPERRFQTSGEVRAALQAAGAAAVDVQRVAPARFSRAAILVSVAAALFMIGFMFDTGHIRERAGGLFSRDVIAFAERDWLLVSSFENQTADPVFDKSLDTALAVGLGQSSYVNVVPASRIRGALQRMKVPETGRIDAATAREIAQRENLKLVLVPGIAEIAGVYQLSGSLHDPATGAVLKSTIVRARSKAEVLSGVDQLVARLRTDLGEAQRSISQQGKPLPQVTTSSLEALKVFALGREAHLAARIDEARGLYEEALRIDPSFTGARASLGILNFELRDREKGRALIAESIQHLDGLTDKERASLVAFHAEAIENNLQKAVDTYVSLLAIYPDAGSAHNNLGRLLMKQGNWEQAAAALKEAIRLEPDTLLTYNSLMQVYLYGLGALDEAIAVAQQQIARNDPSEFPHDALGWAWLGKGDVVLARESFNRAVTINPRNTLALFRLGHSYRLEGRYREARDTFLKIPGVDPAEDSAFYDAGVASQLMGDSREARGHFARFRELLDARIRRNPKSAAQYLELASVLSRLGDGAAAAAAAEKGMALDSNLDFEYACFLSLENRKDEALDRLQRAIERGFRNFVWMKIHVDLEALSAEPRFQTLLANGLKR